MTGRRVVILTTLLIAAAIAGVYYLLIFQITLDHPRVTLMNESDRVRAGLDIILNVRVGHELLPLGGSVDASGGVRYDPSAAQLFLTQPKIEHLELQGVPEQYASRV